MILTPEFSAVWAYNPILVSEGETVRQGMPLLTMNDAVQKATTEQLKSQADAALVMLEELKAQPRKEVLEVARAQMIAAKASLHSSRVQMEKQRKSFELEPQSVSRDTLDNAINAVKVAKANLEVATRQYELTKAGAWVYDIKNQAQQYNALYKSYLAANALLSKYTIKAPVDGVVLSIKAAVGSYISPVGTYETYTQAMTPVLVMGSPQIYLAVRCYIDEILVPRLPPTEQMQAKMFIRGTAISIPWNSSACSRTSRPKSSCPTSVPNGSTSGFCRSSFGLRRPRIFLCIQDSWLIFMSAKNKSTPPFALVEEGFYQLNLPGKFLGIGRWWMFTSGVNGRPTMGCRQTGLHLWKLCVLLPFY